MLLHKRCLPTPTLTLALMQKKVTKSDHGCSLSTNDRSGDIDSIAAIGSLRQQCFSVSAKAVSAKVWKVRVISIRLLGDFATAANGC